MEILHFCPSRSYSGLEQYAFQLAWDQKKKGKSVAFVVSPGSELEQECQRHGIETVLFDPFASFGTLRFWPKLKSVIKQNKSLKVIHLHSTQEISHLFGGLFLGKRKPKIILQTHIWINHRKKDPLHKLLYSVIDEVWCSSEPAKKTLIDNLPVKPERVRIVNYGRDIENLHFLSKQEAREKLTLPKNAVIIGCVSRIEESKGIRELIEAVCPLFADREELRLVIIGGPSPKDDKAKAYADKIFSWVPTLPKFLKQRIHLMGAIPNSYKYLKAFDLYVLPSYEECFSLSLLDAQLAALPVVGSHSGGTPEVVREGQTGWLFTPRDVQSLRAKIQEALNKKDSWSRFGEVASERVRKEFDQKAVFASILRGYEGVP